MTKSIATLTSTPPSRWFTVFQDYSDATTVMIRGRATLRLQNNIKVINMNSESTAVINSIAAPAVWRVKKHSLYSPPLLISADWGSCLSRSRTEAGLQRPCVDLSGVHPDWSPSVSWDLLPAVEGQPCQELQCSTTQNLSISSQFCLMTLCEQPVTCYYFPQSPTAIQNTPYLFIEHI